MIQETLDEMAIACRSVALDDRHELPEDLRGRKLPLLVDQDRVFQGGEAIIGHLSELEKFKKQWYKYQSDVCYCEDD